MSTISKLRQAFAALRLMRELAALSPWATGHEAWPFCFFCGESQEAPHLESCLWQRAVKACNPPKET
jgi:hypothetical protein